MSRLNKEEQEILDAFEAGELQRVADVDETKARHQQYAEAMFRINIRISSRDLRGLQKKALAEGIPYQTLIASILHKYVEGRLQEER
jgi:predicted DNA binding CopG/RHH family protein